MLQFLLGRAGTGKTTEIHRMAAAQVEAGESCILLVQEQNSFETERQMLRLLGPKAAQQVQVFSFRRLAEDVYRRFGRPQGTVLTDGGRRVLMSLALEETKAQLTFFSSCRDPEGLVELLLDFYKELKQCGIPMADLLALSPNVQDEILGTKLQDIGLILSAYEALIAQSYLDPLEDLDRILPLLELHRPFAGETVYIDGFRVFTRQQLAVLRLILQQAAQVVVAMGAEQFHCADPHSLFAPIEQRAAVLWRLAKENQIPIAAPIHLDEPRRFDSAELRFLEAALFDNDSAVWQGAPEKVHLFQGANRFDEARFVAQEIRRLVMEEGYRYRDFTVMARNLAPYRDALDLAFRQHEIACFLDDPQPVESEPLMRAVLDAFAILAGHYDSQTIFAYLKTGMVSGMTAEEIGLLENYTYLWNISGKKWKTPWTEHPEGFSVPWDEKSRALLEQLNSLRQQIITPLEAFAEAAKAETGEAISAAIYAFLLEIGAEDAVLQLCGKLRDLGEYIAAEEQVRLWDLLMSVLDQMALLLRDRAITRERYAALLGLLLSNAEIAGIPKGIDQVTIGEAGRMQPAEPKILFLLGAVQEEFPAQFGDNGIFCDRERREIIAMDLPLNTTLDEMDADERYLAYTAMTEASEALYVSWSSGELSGEVNLPSILVREVKRIFPELRETVRDAAALAPEREALTKETAFRLLAQERRRNNTLSATLRTLLAEEPLYAARCDALERVVQGRPQRFLDRENVNLLYPQHLKLSASRVENFYLCQFRYFCHYGIKAKERRKAEISALEYGSLMHDLLEHLFRDHGHEAICAMPEETLGEIIRQRIDTYINEQFGGKESKTARFLHLFERLADGAALIIRHIAEELSQSQFRPIGYEMELGEDGPFPPLEITTADGSVTVIGTIDRVDLYENGQAPYVRVVDYKTSNKDFLFPDICYGLNLQMLIYLAALVEGVGYRPAGVFYMPAQRPNVSMAQMDSVEKQNYEVQKELRMKGLLVKDRELLKAMDADCSGTYLMTKAKKDGELSGGTTVTAKEMDLVLDYVKHLVGQMAEQLREGQVSAQPLKGDEDHDGCRFCPYHAVCGFETDADGRQWTKRKQEEVLAIIAREEERYGNMDTGTTAGH